MINDENRQKVYIAAALIFVLLLSGFVWFFCAGRSDVSDIRERADNTRAELTDARSAQQSEAGAIESAAEAVSRSSESIRDSQQTAGEIQSIERRDTDLISGSQSIIDRVRERGTAQDTGED